MDTAAIALVCSYVLGSFPTAYIVGRVRKGIDIREVGSRNMGATNVIYQVGIIEGLLVLVVDAGKGAAAVALARWLGASLEVQLAAAGVVVIGHAFPIFLKFRGGKGGAAYLGGLAFLMPQAVPYYLGIFAVLLLLTRFTTFSYGVGLLAIPLMAWLLYDSTPLIVYTGVMTVVLGLRYVPRMQEMRSSAGDWRRVVLRRNLKDRL